MPSLLNELIELARANEDPSLLAEACLVIRCEGATPAPIGEHWQQLHLAARPFRRHQRLTMASDQV